MFTQTTDRRFGLSLLLLVMFATSCATAEREQISQQDPTLHAPPPASEKTVVTSAATANAYERPTIIIQPVQEPAPTTRVVDPYQMRTVKGMSKRRVTLDMREVDIQNALRLFASEGNINISADGDVSGTVTLSVRNAPIDQVFLTMLQSLDLGYEQRGGIIRVAQRAKFEER